MKPSRVGVVWAPRGRGTGDGLRIRAVRRIVLIVLLVIIGAAIGGGIGVGVAIYFLQKQNPEVVESNGTSQDTVSTPIPEAAEVAKQLAVGEETPKTTPGGETARKEATKGVMDTSSVSTVRTETPPTNTVEDTAPKVEIASKDTAKGGVRLGTENLTPKNPKSSTGIGQVSVPTIDLSSTIDLSTPRTRTAPKVPSVEPDLKKTTAPTFTISSLSEEEIKRVYYTEGNLSKAERMLRKELKRNPRNNVAKKYLRLIKLERQALALEAQGDSEGAKRIWRQILKIAPDHPRAKKHLK